MEKKVEEFISANEEWLKAQEAVLGVGVGETDDQPCAMIFVNSLVEGLDDIKIKISEKLAPCPVVFKEMPGGFEI